ncbi:hypothetical protein HanIR_Chr01g0015121 [Helianthus annuus]|nr:hypothetical protein HanIR_Chr01g0015121 [Helianthus annuus]
MLSFLDLLAELCTSEFFPSLFDSAIDSGASLASTSGPVLCSFSSGSLFTGSEFSPPVRTGLAPVPFSFSDFSPPVSKFPFDPLTDWLSPDTTGSGSAGSFFGSSSFSVSCPKSEFRFVSPATSFSLSSVNFFTFNCKDLTSKPSNKPSDFKSQILSLIIIIVIISDLCVVWM